MPIPTSSASQNEGIRDSHLLVFIKDFSSGCLASVAKLLTGHPLDTMKVRTQAMNAAQPTTLSSVLRTTWKNEGVRGFYRGATVNLPCLLVNNSMLFSGFGVASHYFTSNPATLTIPQMMISGSFAGLFTSLGITPFEMMRSRLQIQVESTKTLKNTLKDHRPPPPPPPPSSPFSSSSSSSLANEKASTFISNEKGKTHIAYQSTQRSLYKGPVDLFIKLFRQHGLRGLYKGWCITVLREMPSNAFYFLTYEGLLRAAGYGTNSSKSSQAPFLLVMAAGGCAGIANWTSIYPIDYIKTRYQCDDLYEPRYKSARDCFRQTVATQGWRSLTRGYVACMGRGIVANMFGFLTINYVRMFLYRNSSYQATHVRAQKSQPTLVKNVEPEC
eukprot:TRINITY_DN1350_c0_g3_i1.p1 TRINITY_DN1350_c0_g3~~TRINITY_DN1350_c0_g3_i1.p1  ORF type:complete len:386 (+),score=75.93 TRINITY_DN1350_c0_g3_i1:137-1294(+)